jgi:hypothetical protein
MALERAGGRIDCRFRELLPFRKGDPVPATKCPRCGGDHLKNLLIEEVIVNSREELAALMREQGPADVAGGPTDGGLT